MAARSEVAGAAGAAVFAIVLVSCGGVAPVQDPFNKGVYQFSKGNYDAAIADYREAVDINPKDVLARFNLAVTLEEKAKKDENAAKLKDDARRVYQEVIADGALNPGAAMRAEINLAAMDYEAGDTTGAVARLEEVALRNPDQPLPKAALGATLLRLKRPKEAVAKLEEAKAMDSSGVEVLTLLAHAWVAGGQTEKARQAYAAALGRNPDDLAALRGMARIEFLDGDFVGARSHYQQLLYMTPSDFEARVRMADLLERGGDHESALLHLIEARRLERLGRGDEGPSAIQPPDYPSRIKALCQKIVDGEPAAAKAP